MLGSYSVTFLDEYLMPTSLPEILLLSIHTMVRLLESGVGEPDGNKRGTRPLNDRWVQQRDIFSRAHFEYADPPSVRACTFKGT